MNNTHTSWVWVGSTVLTIAVVTPTLPLPVVTGPGDAIESVVREVSTCFDLNAELAPWLAVSDETLQYAWNLA